MTNQEVINFLDQVRKILLDDKSWLESTTQPINEAFDMVISALQAQEAKNSSQELKNTTESSLTQKGLDVPGTNVGDIINRHAAINTVGSMLRRKFGIGGDLA